MKAGAVDFLQKPFRDQDMLDAVASAIRGNRDRREASRMLSDHAALFASLTQREREVMALATEGMMNKQVSYELRLSEITVENPSWRGHAQDGSEDIRRPRPPRVGPQAGQFPPLNLGMVIRHRAAV